MMDFRWLPPSDVQQLQREAREAGSSTLPLNRFGRIRHAVSLRQAASQRPATRR